jgi:hypothetical protein
MKNMQLSKTFLWVDLRSELSRAIAFAIAVAVLALSVLLSLTGCSDQGDRSAPLSSLTPSNVTLTVDPARRSIQLYTVAAGPIPPGDGDERARLISTTTRPPACWRRSADR